MRPFWLQQALDTEDQAVCPPLIGDARCDVCIVGGGYTGLWTALMLKEQAPELDVMLIEADICGAGASGRNGDARCRGRLNTSPSNACSGRRRQCARCASRSAASAPSASFARPTASSATIA